MGSNYERGMYRQLMDVMARMDAMESEHKKDRNEISFLISEVKGLRKENTKHKAELAEVKAENALLREENHILKQENQLLKDDNERMKRILCNDSSNSSMPPSSDQPRKAPNTYNSRKPTKRKAGAQPGHTGRTVSKADVEKKIREGIFEHKAEETGDPSMPYITR